MFLVVLDTLDVIAIFEPIILLINVDFPTLGLPTKLTNPLFIIILLSKTIAKFWVQILWLQ